MGNEDEIITLYKNEHIMIKKHHISGYFCYIKQDNSWIRCSFPLAPSYELSDGWLALLAPILTYMFERGYDYGRNKLYRETMNDLISETKNVISKALDKYKYL